MKKNLFDVLSKLEWSGSVQGQGSGPMGSGGDGPIFRACPICHGIWGSNEAQRHFMKSALGHRPDCELAAIFREDMDNDVRNQLPKVPSDWCTTLECKQEAVRQWLMNYNDIPKEKRENLVVDFSIFKGVHDEFDIPKVKFAVKA